MIVTGVLAEDVVCTITASEVTVVLEELVLTLDTSLMTGREGVESATVGAGDEGRVGSEDGSSILTSDAASGLSSILSSQRSGCFSSLRAGEAGGT